jgi:Zn-dependent protease with chaperone function
MLAPAVRRADADPAAQSLFAVWAAAMPGTVFLALTTYGLATAASSACLQTVPGRTLFGALAAVAIGAVVRAAARAIRRMREAASAVSTAFPAQARLSRIAGSVGITAYELPDDTEPIVMLFGSTEPRAYVSCRALRDLNDDELRAALHHERAHRERGDHRVAPVLYFLTDLLPLPLDDFVVTYRAAREHCADRMALRHARAIDLAAALLRIARPQPAPAHAAALAETALVRDRLNALLRPGCHEPLSALSRSVLTFAFAAISAASIAGPAIAALLLQCATMGLPT